MSFLIFKNGGILIALEGTNAAWKALYASLSKRKGKLSEQAVKDTVNYAITRGKELGVPFEFTRSVLSNAMQESGMIHNARRGSHYGLIQATWIPRNYNAKQQIDMIYDMAQNPAKYKDNRVLGYEANLLNKSYRNPSTRNFFNWTERAGVRAWNVAPRNVYDSAFDSYYKSVYANPEPIHANPEPVVDYVSPYTVELPDALRVAKPVILPSLKLGGLLRFISFKKGGKLGKDNTLLHGIRDNYNGTVNSYIDGIYANGTEESYGNPSDHYNNVDEEKLKQMTPNARGHYDDSVKLPNHPSSPTRGTFNGQYFDFTDKGFEDPNYTMFGLQDNGDGNAIMRYNGAIVIPELTVTPNGNYYDDTYNNIKIHQGHKHDIGGPLDNTLSEVEVVAKYPHEQRVIDTTTGIGRLLRFIYFKKGGKLRKNDKGETVPEICPKCGGKIGVFIQGEPIFKCTKCGKYFGVVSFSKSK